ncbi:MAG TPA: hypothetical protein VHZ98_16465 [Galbitalea sp.]|nr:hypothetical protein [Galbitalea sp.]
MTDDNSAGYPAPSAEPPAAAPSAPAPVSQPPGDAFDWLVESHQQSAPMAPLTDDVPAPVPAQPRYEFPDPAAPPASYAQPQLQSPAPASPAVGDAPPPTEQFAPRSPLVPRPVEASSPVVPIGLGTLTLERHHGGSRSGTGVLDWVSFVLAFLAPPVGLLAGIAAAVSGSRTKGFVASVAKAAMGIGAGLSLVLGVAFAVVSKIDSDQAAHNAIVASSRAYCAKLQSDPATLTSDTFGWPSPGDTIPDSITAIKAYDATWKSLVTVAPTGILADTKKVEAAAGSILSSVQSTGTLDNASNVAEMQNAVATTGISTWVSDYCK